MTKPLANKPSSDFDFSASMQELEQIAAYLEQSDVDLDKAIEKFERGSQLAKQLKQYLGSVENKVNELSQDFDKPNKASILPE